jgi:Fe-S-cluster-containing hydrogenase component 2
MKDYERTGVLSIKDIRLPSKEQLRKGIAIIECVQEIPCNPCVAACPFGAISMKDINALPIVDFDKCVGCGRCISICPGLAIFLVKIRGDGFAEITLPYEFLPLPKVGDKVTLLDREGKKRGEGKVLKVSKGSRSTFVIKVEVKEELAMIVRNIAVKGTIKTN